MSQSVLIKLDGRLARVTLNRPDVRNAFDSDMIDALTEAFKDLGGSQAVGAILLSGTGATFCAGGDLNWMRQAA